MIPGPITQTVPSCKNCIYYFNKPPSTPKCIFFTQYDIDTKKTEFLPTYVARSDEYELCGQRGKYYIDRKDSGK